MRVLIVGGGGREHALAWKCAQSPRVRHVYAAPGNAGTAQEANVSNVGIAADDIDALLEFAIREGIDLTIIGPEGPLVAGIVDRFAAVNRPCFGPSRAAARLEGSKAFSKDFLSRHGIPTASFATFSAASFDADYVRAQRLPLVVKADGLAAGKGVVVAATEAEAFAAIDTMMEARAFGEAGTSVVLEECLIGEEVSLFALCDGTGALPLGAAQDHKRVGEGETGPNTGGMGAYSPTPSFPPAAQQAAMDGIIRPALTEMARRGTPFRGILYAGLMLTDEGAKLIEFNVRFGDPECQVLLPRLMSDLLPALQAAYDGELQNFDLRWRDATCITVVVAARGYPDAPERGSEIRGLQRAATEPNVLVFHAGTEADAQGHIRAAGGRVLNVCAIGPNVRNARDAAYAAIRLIDWPEGFCRHDIGWRVLAR